MSYFNDNNLLSNKNPYEDSENASLFTVEFCQWSRYVLGESEARNFGVKALESLRTTGKFTPAEDPAKYPGEGFSRDNMIAAVSFGLMFDIPEYRKAGIKEFDFPRYLQPQDVCFFLYGYHWIFKPLILFTFLNMLVSCWNLEKCGQWLSTDGRILSFVRGEALANNGKLSSFLWFLCKKISSKRVKKFFTENPEALPEGMKAEDNQWKLIFGTYFEQNHPINLAVRRIHD